jgi:hypothetical protein
MSISQTVSKTNVITFKRVNCGPLYGAFPLYSPGWRG